MSANLDPQNDVSTTPFNPMVFLSRYQHITQQVFNKVDIKTLKNGRLASKSWQEVIDNQTILWKNHVGTRAFQLAVKTITLGWQRYLLPGSRDYFVEIHRV